MTMLFLNNWRVHRSSGLNPLWTFVLFNIWWSRHDARGTYTSGPVIGLDQSIGFTLFNLGAEVTW